MNTTSLEEPKRRVIVVDDNVDAADTVASLLTILNCSVKAAYSGGQAIALGDVFRPQFVILDIAMPGMDGCETARRIRQRPWGRQACIIALSAWDDQETRRRTAQAGMDVHLAKPITVEVLLNVLAGARS